jgi:hypothetical protein
MQRIHRKASSRVLPDRLRSFEDDQRYHHHDLKHRTPAQLWAEALILQHALARLVFLDARPLLMDHETGQTDQRWLRDRIGRIKTALKKPRWRTT